MTAVNLNRAVRGPVTAVPIVAGKGVRLVADTENNRWVAELDITWEDVTSQITKGSIVASGGWSFYYNAALKLIAIIGEAQVTSSGAVYTLPQKYRPVRYFTVSTPTGTMFIDYNNTTGVFTARSGTNGYFSLYATVPCVGET